MTRLTAFLVSVLILAGTGSVSAYNYLPRDFNVTLDLEANGYGLQVFPPYLLPCDVHVYLAPTNDADWPSFQDTAVYLMTDAAYSGWWESGYDPAYLARGQADTPALDDIDFAQPLKLGELDATLKKPINTREDRPDLWWLTRWMRTGVSAVYLVVVKGDVDSSATAYLQFEGACESTAAWNVGPNLLLAAYGTFALGVTTFACFGLICRDPELKLNPYKATPVDLFMTRMSKRIFFWASPAKLSLEQTKKATAAAATVVPINDKYAIADFWEIESPKLLPGFVPQALDSSLRLLMRKGFIKTLQLLFIIFVIVTTFQAYVFRYGARLNTETMVGAIAAYLALLGAVFLTTYRLRNTLMLKSRAHRLLGVGIVVDLEPESLFAFFGPLILASGIIVVATIIWGDGFSAYSALVTAQLLTLFALTWQGYSLEGSILPFNRLMENETFRAYVQDNNANIEYISEACFKAYRKNRSAAIRKAVTEVIKPKGWWGRLKVNRFSWHGINRDDILEFRDNYTPAPGEKARVGSLQRSLRAPKRLIKFVLSFPEEEDSYDPLRFFLAEPRMETWLQGSSLESMALYASGRHENGAASLPAALPSSIPAPSGKGGSRRTASRKGPQSSTGSKRGSRASKRGNSRGRGSSGRGSTGSSRKHDGGSSRKNPESTSLLV